MEMRDPSTATSRIYIGNLNENVSKADIENEFRRYGNIRGIMLSRNFGFVQYDSEESANNAIQNEHDKMFFQRKIVVRNAVQGTGGEKNVGNNPNANNAQQNADNNNRGQRPPWNQRNNINNNNNSNNNNNNRNQQRGDKIRPMNNNDRDRSPLDRGRGPNMDDRWGQGQNNQNNFGLGPGMNRAGGGGGMGNNKSVGMGGGPGGGMGGGNMSNDMGNLDMGNRPMGRGNMNEVGLGSGNMGPGLGAPQRFPSNLSVQSIKAKHPEANDCEIIVVSKHLTQYAEVIEGRLKRLGLLVDLLFPNEDVPIGRVLANIASRGCLYAILVTPQNQELRSITVNILYGQPAEHRNMPVDDAVEFIYNNFRNLMRGGPVEYPDGDPQSPYANVPQSTVRHPDSISHLTNLLAENRVLTVLQYDCLIKYLQERREHQIKIELGDSSDLLNPLPVSAPAPTLPTNGPDPGKELERKIMEILNKPSIVSSEPSASKPLPQQQSSSNRNFQNRPQSTVTNSRNQQDPQLLNDPKVQKALDSLLSNNSFNF